MSKRVFAFHYVLRNTAGEILDQSDEGQPISFLEGAGQIIPGLESQLLPLKTGDKREVSVGAAQAYGERDEKLVVKVPRDQIPSKDVKIGDMFRGGPDEDAPVFTVTEVTTSHVTVDANHPLAGEDLTFSIVMAEIRQATAEEIAHGHAHGPGGHHHH
jgi:FKBP-type peptidyl-prolyl cis-trans isomerase SlyD